MFLKSREQAKECNNFGETEEVLRCAIFFFILESNDDCKSPEGVDVKHQELTKQEKEFYDMSKELSCDKHHPNTIQFFMTYCPESLSYLLDRWWCNPRPKVMIPLPNGIGYYAIYMGKKACRCGISTSAILSVQILLTGR